MKTNNSKWPARGYHYVLFFSLCTVMFNCSKKNDAPDPFITVEPIKLTSTDVNGCTLSSGAVATEFVFTIPYKTSPGITIATVEYSSVSSNGSKTSGSFSVSGDGTDGNVDAYVCIRFNSTTWSERTYTLVSTSGVKSNSSVLKINKPAGAE